MNEYSIYKITNTKTHKEYIGITKKTVHKRLLEHRSHSRNGSTYKFHLALNKYKNISDWNVEILEFGLSFESAKLKEIFYIKKFDTFRNGYNSTLGGEGTKGISRNNRGQQNPMFGKKHKQSSIEKNRQSNIEYAKNHSKKQSEETKKKISNSKAKSWKITYPSGDIIFIKNLTQFCKTNKLDQGHMTKVAQHKLKAHKNFLCEKV